MKGIGQKYLVSDDYIIRQPLLGLDVFKKIASDNSSEELLGILRDKKVREAIYIASPSLLKEWDRRIGPGERKALMPIMLKYIARMSYRCVPFGLSAGIAVQKMGLTTNKVASTRRTRLDSEILDLLYRRIMKEEEISEKMIFNKNSSLYKVNGDWRYIKKRKLGKDLKRALQKIKGSEIFTICLSLAETGMSRFDMIIALNEQGYDSNEAKEYVDSLVKSQILIPKIAPYAVGPPYLSVLIEYLTKTHPGNKITKMVNGIQKMLNKIDDSGCNEPEAYERILSILREYITIEGIRNPFHVELFNYSKTSELPKREKALLKKEGLWH